MRIEQGTGQWSCRPCEAGELAEMLSALPPDTLVVIGDGKSVRQLIEIDREYELGNTVPVAVVLYAAT